MPNKKTNIQKDLNKEISDIDILRHEIDYSITNDEALKRIEECELMVDQVIAALDDQEKKNTFHEPTNQRGDKKGRNIVS